MRNDGQQVCDCNIAYNHMDSIVYVCMYFMQGKCASHHILLRTTEHKRKLQCHEMWLHARDKGLISV